MAHIKIYIVTTLYLYRDLKGNYTTGNSDYSTPYLYTNLKKAKGFISRITERWKNEGYVCYAEPSDMNDNLSHFHKCIWKFINTISEGKRVIILDPTLTE